MIKFLRSKLVICAIIGFIRLASIFSLVFAVIYSVGYTDVKYFHVGKLLLTNDNSGAISGEIFEWLSKSTIGTGLGLTLWYICILALSGIALIAIFFLLAALGGYEHDDQDNAG